METSNQISKVRMAIAIGFPISVLLWLLIAVGVAQVFS